MNSFFTDEFEVEFVLKERRETRDAEEKVSDFLSIHLERGPPVCAIPSVRPQSISLTPSNDTDAITNRPVDNSEFE
jgi:hypothetical protein